MTGLVLPAPRPPAAARPQGPSGPHRHRRCGRVARDDAPDVGVRDPGVPRHGDPRQLRALLQPRHRLRDRARPPPVDRLPAPPEHGVGGVLHPGPLRRRRHDADGVGDAISSSIFLALETMSLSLYVLAGFFRDRIEAGEASMKYFLLGAFASGFFLYGIALVFGATGSTNLDRIAAAVAAGAPPATRCSLIGVRAAPRGVRVQDLGGSLPPLGARRLPGRADLGHRVHRHRLEGGGLRRAPPRALVVAPRRSRSTGRGSSGCSPSSA